MNICLFKLAIGYDFLWHSHFIWTWKLWICHCLIERLKHFLVLGYPYLINVVFILFYCFKFEQRTVLSLFMQLGSMKMFDFISPILFYCCQFFFIHCSIYFLVIFVYTIYFDYSFQLLQYHLLYFCLLIAASIFAFDNLMKFRVPNSNTTSMQLHYFKSYDMLVRLVYPCNLLILTLHKLAILLHHIPIESPWILVSLIVIL